MLMLTVVQRLCPLGRKLWGTVCCVVIAMVLCGQLKAGQEEAGKSSSKNGKSNGFWRSVHNFFLPHVEERKIMLEKETEYVQLRVEVDSSDHRHLVFLPNKGSQGIWDPKSPRTLVSNYLKCSLAVLGALPHPPEKVLFIGLGPGIFPMFLRHHFPDMQIDIVEIDEEIVRIAESHFGFKKDEKMTVTVADGRVFVNKTKNKYDLIYVDAYNAHAIPFHLTTVEFFSQLKNCLSKDGLVAMNIAFLGKRKFIASELLTLQRVFNHLLVYFTPGQTNYVPLASENCKFDAETIAKRVAELDKTHFFNVDTDKYLKNYLTQEQLKDFINEHPTTLTDDFAPVNDMD